MKTTSQDPLSITERVNAVCREVDTRPDPFVAEAARRILVEVDAETRFRARAASGSAERGLELLDKLDAAKASPR